MIPSIRRSLPRVVIPVVIQDSIVFTPEPVYNSDSDGTVEYASDVDAHDVDNDPLPDFSSCPIICNITMEYDTEEDKKLILQDKLKALKNLLRFWENTYNDLCKSVAETDDLLCTAVGAA